MPDPFVPRPDDRLGLCAWSSLFADRRAEYAHGGGDAELRRVVVMYGHPSSVLAHAAALAPSRAAFWRWAKGALRQGDLLSAGLGVGAPGALSGALPRSGSNAPETCSVSTTASNSHIRESA